MEKMKITLIFFCALFFFTGCQENNINPDFSSEGLVLPPKPLDPPVLVPKPKLPFNVDALRASALNTFDSIEAIATYPLIEYPNGLPPISSGTQVIESPYNNAQIALLQPFIDKILQDNITTTLVRQEVKTFEDKVASSLLKHDEKLMLIALSSNVIVAVDFIDNGGAEEIQRQVNLQLGGLNSSNGSPGFGGVPPPPGPGTPPGTGGGGPCVNTKNILRGAVVGGMASSVYGAYVGATGGTIVVPFLGTAVGGVAGAVVGFATGFTSGVLIGIATDMLFECTKTRKYNARVDCSAYFYSNLPCEFINEAALRNGGLKLTPDSNLVSQIY